MARGPTDDRPRRVLELRRAGLSFEEIATQTGCADWLEARNAYEEALAGSAAHLTAEEARRLELDRLDRLQVAVWPKAARGDLAAVDRVLRIIEQRQHLQSVSRLAGGPADREPGPTAQP